MAVPSKPLSDRLALLYHLSQTFNSSLDLDEVLKRVMDEVIVATRAERGFVMLVESGIQSSGSGLVFRAARGIDQETINDPQFQISRSVVEIVARDGQPMLTSDAQHDERFSMRQSVFLLGLRSILCVPLIVKDRLLGVIYVDNRMQAGVFTHSDLEMLTAIASSAAIAIDNARLYQVAVDKGRLEKELQMAHQVQVSLLPHQVPQLLGWEFAALWHPAREVSGDYYDFIEAEPGKLGLIIGDVSDKGMPAALFMALTRTTVRASLKSKPSPAEGIALANGLISADSTDGYFVTLLYALLDTASGDLTYVNAGHSPPLLYHAAINQFVILKRTGMSLGVDETSHYGQYTVHLDPGDFILLYTDGVTEAANLQGKEFGMERLHHVATYMQKANAKEMAAALEQAVCDFGGCDPLSDDITILVAKRLA
jgi:sigma-B regulation protein RsbU (phosphoserine phosphatase)